MNKPKNNQEINHSLPHNHFLSGAEQFTFENKEIGHSLLDYWSWSFSDIYNNIYRGIMAEYIVATALGITPPKGLLFVQSGIPMIFFPREGGVSR